MIRCGSTRIGAAATALLSLACSLHDAPGASHGGTSTALHDSPQPVEAARSKEASEGSCKDMGLLPCDVPPSPIAELCPLVASCLIGAGDPANGAPSGDLTCGPLRNSAPAPAGTRLLGIAVVAIEGQADESSAWRTEATYLVAETSRGFCLVDQLIPWDLVRDYSIDTKFELTWSAEAAPRPELDVVAQLVAQLDSDEGTFVDHEWCYRDRYAVAGGNFQSLHKSDNEGHCSAARKR